jgi:hypothetical protein
MEAFADVSISIHEAYPNRFSEVWRAVGSLAAAVDARTAIEDCVR